MCTIRARPKTARCNRGRSGLGCGGAVGYGVGSVAPSRRSGWQGRLPHSPLPARSVWRLFCENWLSELLVHYTVASLLHGGAVTGGGGFATFRGTPRAKRRATVRPNTPPRRSPPVVWAEGAFSSGWTAVPGPNRTAHRRSPAHFEVPPPPRRAARAPRPGRGPTSRPKHVTPSLAAPAPASRPTRSSLAAVLTATIPPGFLLGAAATPAMPATPATPSSDGLGAGQSHPRNQST